MKHAVGVGDVYDVFVAEDFGYEGARVEVVGNGHPEAESEGVGVFAHYCFDESFGLGVEASGEVGWVGFFEGDAGEGGVVGGVGGGVDACSMLTR